MSSIRILDEATISKIAAGEVIERPASVVKELVENSLDAGANDIRVKIAGAGKELIEVIDDGSGISRDDLKLAFVQHATSKLSLINDLESLETMGFRGEALSSIVSVANVFISSRIAGSATGFSLEFKRDKPGELKEIARPVGTTIEARKLFSGHPARLKYLKSDRVEIGHIIDIMTERALANPNVAFRLHNEDVEVMDLPRSENFLDRINDLMGRKIAREIIFFQDSGDGIHLDGYMAKPTITKSTRDGFHLFVNSRPVSSPIISEAVETGYAGLLMRNRHPVGVLMLEIDPKILDVNVHPTKKKVRFADEKIIARLVSQTVAKALGNVQHIPDVAPRQKELFPIPQIPDSPSARVKLPIPAATKTPSPNQSQLVAEAEAEEVAEDKMLPRMKVIGQILDTFILAQSGSDMIIIDQHAAHEKIMLDKLRNRPEKKTVQNLITPVLLNLGKKESQLVEHFRPVIEDLGFKIEPFGKDAYLVRAVPAIGGHIETEKGLLDLIDELAALGKARSIEEKRDEIIHLVACHSAIRAGEKLSQQRMAHLIEEMHGLENPYTCAHGRPTIIRITNAELERMFKRAV
ncbi:MAG: DNA mismatch repair endonuclease MutL [Thermoplasmata archaeon]|nr:DNA mismatch repair endonuclease MutL [Thermoplasmata archaeon]